MKLVTYNVNGIRAAQKKGLFDWIIEHDLDIVCIQETKSQPEQVDLTQLHEAGYHDYWHSAVKKGYSGVLTLSKQAATSTTEGMSNEKYDIEGRVLRTDFEHFTLLNCYFPSGSSGDERHAFKVDFLTDFRPYVNALLKERKELIIVGDYNVVRLDYDIHNPKRKDKPSGFRPEERAWLNEWFDTDFKDAFREFTPDKEDEFSWWSYRMGARKRNKGWRIDYISVSNALAEHLTASRMMQEAVHSDHCPVLVELGF